MDTVWILPMCAHIRTVCTTTYIHTYTHMCTYANNNKPLNV